MKVCTNPGRQIPVLLLFMSLPLLLQAAGDLTRQEPVEIVVKLGSPANKLRFFPSTIHFETGRLYRLKLINPSPTKHYFSSARFASSVFTRKVQINRPDGKAMVEVKGQVREIEVYPGHFAEWWFVPVKTGVIDDLHCAVKGHTKAGMVGKITIR